MKKFFPILFLPLLLGSCQYFDKQVPSEKELLQEQLKSINWSKVDEYPSISSCDSVQDREKKKLCFFETLTQLIQEKLNGETLAVLYPKHDTISVKVTVMPNATMLFDPQLNDSLSYNTAKIDSIIKVRLVDFPAVNPAIKRGIPVKTMFVVPVVLKIE